MNEDPGPPPGTPLYGTKPWATNYARDAGFLVNERGKVVVASRDDITDFEYQLRSHNGRYYWRRFRRA